MESKNAGNKKPARLIASRVFWGIADQTLPITWWTEGGSNSRPPHCERGAPEELNDRLSQ